MSDDKIERIEQAIGELDRRLQKLEQSEMKHKESIESMINDLELCTNQFENIEKLEQAENRREEIRKKIDQDEMEDATVLLADLRDKVEKIEQQLDHNKNVHIAHADEIAKHTKLIKELEQQFSTSDHSNVFHINELTEANNKAWKAILNLEQQIEKQINEFRIILLGYNKLLDNGVNRDEFLGRTVENIEAVLKRFIPLAVEECYANELLKQLEGQPRVGITATGFLNASNIKLPKIIEDGLEEMEKEKIKNTIKEAINYNPIVKIKEFMDKKEEKAAQTLSEYDSKHLTPMKAKTTMNILDHHDPIFNEKVGRAIFDKIPIEKAAGNTSNSMKSFCTDCHDYGLKYTEEDFKKSIGEFVSDLNIIIKDISKTFQIIPLSLSQTKEKWEGRLNV